VAEKDFFGERAKKEVAAAVSDIESATSAEVVVAVRRAAGHYRHIDYLAGALLAFGVLLILLFHPRAFAVATMPLDVLVMFAVGAAASAYSPTLRRLLSSRKLRAEEMNRAARATFVDLGISRTRQRTGVLIYVGMLEHAVEVVCDSGVETCAACEPFQKAVGALRQAVARTDLDAFVAALRGLKAPLCDQLPRSHDDVNELPDALHT
jgi:putative membrane protein